MYNIGNNTPERLERLIEVLESVLGRAAIKRYLPMQPGDVPETYADATALEQAVGFRPDTPIGEGIAHFVKWFVDFTAGARYSSAP